jgi:ssDNA thymidine ADP-ribosyltransferase, DarT
MTSQAIKAAVEDRRITRICHFTPMRNLVHIATDDAGLLSTLQLTDAERGEFNQQDLERLDGFPDHISCSIQYPNAYYMRTKKNQARGEAKLFPGWVCLLIKADHLWNDTTLFCAHNAAGGRGAVPGIEAFHEMFADKVFAPRGTWQRQKHPDFCPTDAQAEVMVHRQIPRNDITGIVFESEAQAGNTYVALRQLGAPVAQFSYVIAPDFYAPTRLAGMLSAGRLPVGSPWHPPTDGELAGHPGSSDA